MSTFTSSNSTSSSPLISFLLALLRLIYFILSNLPNWIWFGIILYSLFKYLTRNNNNSSTSNRSKRRRQFNNLPSSPQIQSQLNQPKQSFPSFSSSSSSGPTSPFYNRQSPQISRRSSAVWGNVPSRNNINNLSGSRSFSNLGTLGGGEGRPLMRGAYSSQRISSLAGSPSLSRFNDDSPYQSPRPSSSSLSHPFDLPSLFPIPPPRQQPPPASPSVYRRRFTDNIQSPNPFSSTSTSTTTANTSNNLGRKRSLTKRKQSDEFDQVENREGKRFKEFDETFSNPDENDDYGNEMEVDENIEFRKRGTKRAVSEEDADEVEEEREDRRKSRNRKVGHDDSFDQDELEEEEEEEEEEEMEESRIDYGSNSSDESIIQTEEGGKRRRQQLSRNDLVAKKSKAGTRGKPSSKRVLEQEEESYSDDEVEGRRRTRNADSEGEEEEDVEGDVEEEKKESKNGESIKKSKSSRSRSNTTEQDEDLMEGAFAIDSPPPSPPPSTSISGSSNRKRTLSSKLPKKSQSSLSLASRRTPNKVNSTNNGKIERKIGEEWINLEGDKYKIGTDGLQRRRCEVRESRKKFKMPIDSKHPDRNITHQVVVEKWLTDAEFEKAVKANILAWQSVDPIPVVDNKSTAADAIDGDLGDDSMQNEAPVESQVKESGIYYTPGTGTPLRTHSGLSSTYSSASKSTSRPGTPLSSSNITGISPLYKNHLNGRLRLPSTSTPGSNGKSGRSWSEMKARNVVEDEEVREKEREKRRAASVRLGGEDVEKIENVSDGKGKEKEVIVEEKLTFAPEKSLFGIPPISTNATSNTAPSSLFALPPKSVTSIPPLSFTTTPLVAQPIAAAAKVLDFFSKPAATKIEATAPTPPPTTSTPNFFGNLGASTKSTSVAPVAAPASNPPSLFSFGAAPTAKITEIIPPKPVAPLSFGTPTSLPASPAANSTPSGFNFGATVPSLPIPTHLSFTAPVSTSVQTPAFNSFSFGKPASLTPPPPIISPTTSGFNFAPTTSAAVPNNSFSFGPESNALPTPPTLPISTSLFGTATSAVTATTTGGFSFGKVPSVPSFGMPSTSTSSPFSFGAPSVTPSIAPGAAGFSFGGNSTPAAPSTFSGFGSGANTPTFSTPAPAPATSGGFNFGATPSAGGALPNMFGGGGAGFGAGGSESGDERRTIRKRPVRKG